MSHPIIGDARPAPAAPAAPPAAIAAPRDTSSFVLAGVNVMRPARWPAGSGVMAPGWQFTPDGASTGGWGGCVESQPLSFGILMVFMALSGPIRGPASHFETVAERLRWDNPRQARVRRTRRLA